MYNICLKQLSSLDKVFIDNEPKVEEIFRISALKGEEISYQIAYSKETSDELERKSDDLEYIDFLSCFLPKLTTFLKGQGILDKTYFHISDEPAEEHLESYKKVLDIVKPYIKGFKRIDALSNIA